MYLFAFGALAAMPIVGGEIAADPRHDAVVRVALEDGGGGFALCSGALVAPNLVLTARHCVAALRSDDGFACDPQGRTASGDARFAEDADPGALAIYLGASRTPAARGARIVHDDGDSICTNDVALVVLDRAIPGVAPLPVRLSGKGTEAGETFTAIGYGVGDDGRSGARRLRTRVVVERVGPGRARDGNAVPPGKFQAGQAVCSGDSGGPAIATTGAVFGVVSTGTSRKSTSDRVESCRTSVSHYAMTVAFAETVRAAASAAGASVAEEVGSGTVLAANGTACDAPEACAGGLCVAHGDAGRACAQPCFEDDSCPSGLTCSAASGARACVPKEAFVPPPRAAPGSGGCTSARSPISGGAAAAAAMAALAVLRRRRQSGMFVCFFGGLLSRLSFRSSSERARRCRNARG